MAVDDAYSKVLLHFNGDDASDTFTDEAGKTWTAGGDAQLDTAQKNFGTASLLLDGTGDYITTDDSDDFAFGSGDFTIDFWLRFSTVAVPSGIFDQYQDNSNLVHCAFNYGTLYLQVVTGGSTVNLNQENWSPSADTWYHIAFVKHGTNSYQFIDGTKVKTTTYSGDYPNNTGTFNIGTVRWNSYTNAGYMNGWIDEFRVSKGIARWTSDFSVPTAEYGDSPPATVVKDVIGGAGIIPFSR